LRNVPGERRLPCLRGREAGGTGRMPCREEDALNPRSERGGLE
jgi:hypothetical protein